MSSLYEAIFQRNPNEKLLLKMLYLDNHMELIGRYRDIYLNANGTKIILYTRNGGGNRKEYQWVFDNFKKHPQYIKDWDDDYDNTFAYIEFRVPYEFKEEAKELATGEEPLFVGNKFKKLDEDLKNNIVNENTQRAMKVGEQIFGQMEEAIKKGNNGGIIMGDAQGDN